MAYTEEELKKELETKEYEYGFYQQLHRMGLVRLHDRPPEKTDGQVLE